MTNKKCSCYAEIYNPIVIGNKDANDTEPHDNAIVRACNAVYRPDHLLTNNPQTTLFIGRLDKNVTEKDLEDLFSKYGKLKNTTVVRDVVTRCSKRYGFVEFKNKSDCHQAKSEHQTILKGRKIIVEVECQHILPGWIPRRLGGGFGGKKESGQLRFGCIDRPWKKPVHVQLNSSKTLISETLKHYVGESPRGTLNLHEISSETEKRSKDNWLWSPSKRSQTSRFSENSSNNLKRRKI